MSTFLRDILENYEGNDLCGTEKHLLVQLAWKCNDDGLNAYPSIKTMARLLGRKKRTILYALKKLKAKGLIVGLPKITVFTPVNYLLNLHELVNLENFSDCLNLVNQKHKNQFMALCEKRGVALPKDTQLNMHAKNARDAKDTQPNMHAKNARDAKDTQPNMHAKNAHNTPFSTLKNKQQHRDSQVSRAPENNLEVSALPKEPLPTIPEEPDEEPKQPIEKPVEKPRPKPRANASGCCDEKLEQEVGHCIVDTPETNTEAQEPIQNEKDIQTHQFEFKNDSRAREEVDIKTAVQRVIDSGSYGMSEDGQRIFVYGYWVNLNTVRDLINNHGENKVIQQLKLMATDEKIRNPDGWLKSAVQKDWVAAPKSNQAGSTSGEWVPSPGEEVIVFEGHHFWGCERDYVNNCKRIERYSEASYQQAKQWLTEQTALEYPGVAFIQKLNELNGREPGFLGHRVSAKAFAKARRRAKELADAMAV